MASGLSSPFGIIGIIMVIIGIIMAIVGIIILIINQNSEKPWYIWVLLIGGIVLGVIGGIMIAIALSQEYNPTRVPVVKVSPVPVITQPVITQPVITQPVITQPVITQPVVQPSIRYVQQQAPVQYVQHSQPTRPHTVTYRHELVGKETLDPDPKTYMYETQQPARRVVYQERLANGQIEQGTGVYHPPNTRTYYSDDVEEHEVHSQNRDLAPVQVGQTRYRAY